MNLKPRATGFVSAVPISENASKREKQIQIAPARGNFLFWPRLGFLVPLMGCNDRREVLPVHDPGSHKVLRFDEMLSVKFLTVKFSSANVSGNA